MSGWNGLDFFIFLILAINTIIGMARGASRELISIMCLSLALIFTIKFTLPLSQFLGRSPIIIDVINNQFIINLMKALNLSPLTLTMISEIIYSISLLICFVGIYSVGAAALSIAGFNEFLTFPYAAFSRKVGAALGCTRGFIISIIFLSILMFHLYKDNNMYNDSYFAKLFQSSALKLDPLITARTPEYYSRLFKGKDLYSAEKVIKVLQPF